MPGVPQGFVNELNQVFWKAAGAGRFVMPHCMTTGRAFWPPSAISPYHAFGEVEWRPVEPTGQLVSRVAFRRSFLKSFEGVMPYAVGLVELASGPRVLGFIASPDNPDAANAGDAVTLGFEPLARAEPCPLLVIRKSA